MAIPFEAAPATVFKESDIAEFGLALQDRQEAKEAQDRERYEKMLESVSGPYWAERDTWIAQGGNKLLEMATDPAYYKAPIGSANHNKFIRAKRQYEQLLATSAANQKYFNEQLKFAQQNPDAEGMQDLNAYVGMDMQGDVEIDEAGNFVVAGQPIITSDAMSTPPSLRKRVEMYSSDDFLSKVKLGTKKYENESGVTTITPNDAMGLVTMRYKVLEPRKQSDLLTAYVMSKYSVDRDEVSRMDADMLAVEEGDMLKEYADIILQETNTATTREKEGGRGGLLGEFDKKSFVKIEPKFGSNVVPSGTEFKSGLAIPNVPFISNYLAPAKEGETTASVGSGGDKGEIIFVSEVAQDKDGNLYVSGVKSVGDITKLVALGDDGRPALAQGVNMNFLQDQGYKTRTINKFKLEGNDAANFIAAMKIQGVNSVDQFKKAMDDFYGVTAEPQAQGGQSSAGSLNASEIKQKKQNTNQNPSNELNTSNRKGGASVQSNQQGDKEQSNAKGPQGLAISEEESSAIAEDEGSVVVNNETKETVVESPNGELPRSVAEYNKREGLSKDDMLVDVFSNPIYGQKNDSDSGYNIKKQIKSAYGEDKPIILSRKVDGSLKQALLFYEDSLTEDEKKDFIEGRSPIVIADTYVPSSVKLEAKEKYEKNLESYKKNGYWVNDSNQTVKTPPPKQAGEKSFHTSGNAIDLAQNKQNKNNKKLFNSLRKAGFKQHQNEWWHWSIGEFEHEELTDEQVEGRAAEEEYSGLNASERKGK